MAVGHAQQMDEPTASPFQVPDQEDVPGPANDGQDATVPRG